MSIFNMTGVNEAQVGDLKDSIGTLSSKWLSCNGAGVNSADYPVLVPLLQTANPTVKDLNVNQTAFGTGAIYAQGVCYYNGRWVLACSGYRNSSVMYLPVIYTTTDLYGEWKEVRLSTDQYFLAGVCYDSRWGDWVAYGYKYVSSTECYPYIFYAADPEGEWRAVQVASTNCKITCGCYENRTLVLLAKATSGSTAYCYVAEGSISFTEYTISTSFSGGLRGLSYGNGYWGFVDNSTNIWYTDDLTGSWTKKSLGSGFQLRDLCCGNGRWVAVGTQSSGGYGRLYHSTDITGTFTNYGTMTASNGNEVVAYCGGVFLVLCVNLGSSRYYYYSADGCATFTRKEMSEGNLYDAFGYDGKFVVAGMYRPFVIRRPQADAVLPELTPDMGTTYIKAL